MIDDSAQTVEDIAQMIEWISMMVLAPARIAHKIMTRRLTRG